MVEQPQHITNSLSLPPGFFLGIWEEAGQGEGEKCQPTQKVGLVSKEYHFDRLITVTEIVFSRLGFTCLHASGWDTWAGISCRRETEVCLFVFRLAELSDRQSPTPQTTSCQKGESWGLLCRWGPVCVHRAAHHWPKGYPGRVSVGGIVPVSSQTSNSFVGIKPIVIRQITTYRTLGFL